MATDDLQTISSVIEMIDIDKVKDNLLTILDSSFHSVEQKELDKRHIRSTAGVLALKQAICSLIHNTTGLSLERKNVLISRSTTGAPILQSLPDTLKTSSFDHRNLFLSISHSRKTAYGLAVYQERIHG